MNAIHQLKTSIQTLDCEHVQHHRAELLSLVDSILTLYPTGSGDSQHRRLSPREREVMNMILAGQRLKEIAARLDISVKTVTTHRSRLLRKLGVEDNLGLFRYGVRNGLIGV